MGIRSSLATYVRSSRVLLAPFRLRTALSYVLPRFGAVFTWLVSSREHTNFTYDITDLNLEHLVSIIAVVTGRPCQEIAGYVREPLADTELQSRVLERAQASRYAAITDPICRFGRRLGWYAFVRALKPRVVIETGIDKGLGSVLLCSALLRNASEGHAGKYYGLDINPEAGYLLVRPYDDFGKIIVGDSITTLSRLVEPIDLFINDSDHSAEYEYEEYRTIRDKLSPEGIILGDNSHETDCLLRFSRENGRQFLFFKEAPSDHWYTGAGIGISFP